MYLLLTSFFLSLIGITFMVGRKLVLLKNGNITATEENAELLNIKELRQNAFQNIKKYEHIVLVAIVRFYIKTVGLIKIIYKIIKSKIKSIHRKKQKNGGEKVEVSKFLKVVSEYKQKIREIKHQIKEEEKL
ncbi:MAG: hypothetical protein Q7K54_02750 [Candidatus Parcubacteria bacterium]|nr:hypothetical protein [Candidatus Parcubacteria bacterium]